MTNKTVTFAVVGCGRISGTHIKAIKDAPSAKLVAVCDIKPELAKKRLKIMGAGVILI